MSLFGMSPSLPADHLFLAAIAVLLAAISYLVQTKSRKRTIHQKISAWLPDIARGRRTSSSATPPRSLTPEKKVPSNTPPSNPYRDIFPPSTRENLPSSLLAGVNRSDGEVDVNQVATADNIIPFDQDYRDADPLTLTPMGITIGEVKALGDFPNYSEVNGVPLPQAYKEHKLETALPRPYRPFRWAYHQTMSLTRMEPDWWLELENTYKDRISLRMSLFEKHGKLVLNYLPGSELGSKEVMEHALQFYCARYPQYFSMYESKSKGHVFKNGILETETVINEMHPLHVLLRNIPEDFAVMLRNPEDGMYYFRAGLLCSSLGWNVDTKLGMQLKEIHQPIPDYKEKMEFSMDRYFSRLPCDRPIQRGSWGLEVDQPLFMPPGDPHEHHRTHRLPPTSLPPSRIHLRVDWQTLRRLPLSGAIIFNFKALFTPLPAFRTEPYIPALLLKILREGKKEIMQYKNTWHVEHVAVPKLEEWAREQEEKGWVERGWEVGTLKEGPWFPGWEGRWRGEQGF